MTKMRARDLGIPFSGQSGTYNAITDVPGVEVGFRTIIYGEPEDYKGVGSPFARTGVTAILPRGKRRSAVFAGRYNLNGNGEMTGTHWLDDSGFMHGPLMITNTHSVGIVRDITTQWMLNHNYYYPYIHEGQEIKGMGYFYPTVGETWDGILNDTNGYHVTAEDVIMALDSAKSESVQEGNVGGGTGMICHEFKGGTGTASRVLSESDGGYTVGVLVQANHGTRDRFQIRGIPLGKAFDSKYDPVIHTFAPKAGTGSIIAVVATDAPLLPWQLTQLAKRVPIGIGLLGAYGNSGSGDIFLAFSTANEKAYSATISTIELLSDERIDPLYIATIEAVEEAVLNALCAAETMVGPEGNKISAMPHDQLMDSLKTYGGLCEVK